MQKKSHIFSNSRAGGSTATVVGAYVTKVPLAADCSGVLPEFGRAPDVQRIFGIKRGKLYQKIKDGTIKSISLREPGKKFGCRLIHLVSIRVWLYRELEAQNTPKLPIGTNPDLGLIKNLANRKNSDQRFVKNKKGRRSGFSELLGEK